MYNRCKWERKKEKIPWLARGNLNREKKGKKTALDSQGGNPKTEKNKTKQKTLDSQGETQNREKTKQKTLDSQGESMKHIASKCSRIGEQCVEAHVHTPLELCAVFKPRSAVGLLLARSRSVPEVTTWPKPRNLNDWSLTLPRCWGFDTNKTLEHTRNRSRLFRYVSKLPPTDSLPK